MTHKFRSRRITNKIVKTKINNFIKKMTKSSPKRKRLIYRQFNTFYSKKYFSVCLLDTCSDDTLHNVYDSCNIKTELINQPVINQELGEIIDSYLCGFYCHHTSEIVLTNNLYEIKLYNS
jgi:hypothetical protein